MLGKLSLRSIGILCFVSSFPQLCFSQGFVPGIRNVEEHGVRERSSNQAGDIITFPGTDSDTEDFRNGQHHDGFVEIPDFNQLSSDQLSQISNLHSMNSFASFLGLKLPEKPNGSDVLDLIGLRFGSRGTIIEAVPAGCKPTPSLVHLDLPEDENIVYFPTCVWLEQCGGCCPAAGRSCQPTEIQPLKYRVLQVFKKRRRRRSTQTKYTEVAAEKHLSCNCGCTVMESHCNLQFQKYDHANCQCVCKNQDEKSRCKLQNQTHFWDRENCKCSCRKSFRCSTGEFFSQQTCQCTGTGPRNGYSRSNNKPVDTIGIFNKIRENARYLPEYDNRRIKVTEDSNRNKLHHGYMGNSFNKNYNQPRSISGSSNFRNDTIYNKDFIKPQISSGSRNLAKVDSSNVIEKESQGISQSKFKPVKILVKKRKPIRMSYK